MTAFWNPHIDNPEGFFFLRNLVQIYNLEVLKNNLVVQQHPYFPHFIYERTNVLQKAKWLFQVYAAGHL